MQLQNYPHGGDRGTQIRLTVLLDFYTNQIRINFNINSFFDMLFHNIIYFILLKYKTCVSVQSKINQSL